MLDHVSFSVNNHKESCQFYDATLSLLGIGRIMSFETESGKEGIGRAFFCMLVGKEVIILHSFIKKTQQTPEKELKIAKKRLREVLDEN